MPDVALTDSRLLDFSRRLQFATDYDTMLRELCDEVRATTPYQSAWVGVYLPQTHTIKVLMMQAEGIPVDWVTAQELPVDTDPYLSQLLETRAIAIVEDAQTDPRVNREVVEMLGNRTIVNVPMTFGEAAFGALGTGSFGDEGVIPPTPEQLDYLSRLANIITAASVRILKVEQRRAELRERSHETFDEIAQLLAGIEAYAATLSDEAESTRERIVENVKRVEQLVEAGREAMRTPI